MADDLPADLREAAGRMAHAAYRAAPGREHLPDACPCRDGHEYQGACCSSPGLHAPNEPHRYCIRCGLDVRLSDEMAGMCRDCNDDMAAWPDLTDEQREQFRASQDPALSLVAPVCRRPKP